MYKRQGKRIGIVLSETEFSDANKARLLLGTRFFSELYRHLVKKFLQERGQK